MPKFTPRQEARKPFSFPTRLRVAEGHLLMDDGSDPAAYLAKNLEVGPDEPLTLMKASLAQKLLEDAKKWHEYQLSIMAQDERFALAA